MEDFTPGKRRMRAKKTNPKFFARSESNGRGNEQEMTKAEGDMWVFDEANAGDASGVRTITPGLAFLISGASPRPTAHESLGTGRWHTGDV